MIISPRVAVPIILALALSAGIGGVFLYQIHSSISAIESSFGVQGSSTLLRRMLPTKNHMLQPSVSQSQALMDLRQGEIFELKGEWKQAQDHYEKSVSSGGGSPALKKLASIQLQRRQYDSAKKTIASLKEQYPRSEEITLLEGMLSLRTGNPSGAIAIFNRFPNSPQSHYGLGLTAISQNDIEGAKKELSLAANGTDPIVRTYAKTILAAFDEFALFPHGQHVHLQTLLARSLAQVNECETALPMLTTVVLKQERYRDAWIVKGYCEFNSERLKDALTSLEQAYSLDPEKAETQYFLARTHAALGDPQNAVTYLQYALLNGFTPEKDARDLLADYALELGNTDLALEQLKILAQAKDSELRAYERFVNLAAGNGNHALDALQIAKEALVRWPDDSSTLSLAAKAAFGSGLPDDAQKYLSTALKLDPRNPRALEVQKMMEKAEGATKK